MIIKKYIAKTEVDAIEQAKADLGPGAVVMNIKKMQPKGITKIFMRAKVEVTAALDENKDYSENKQKESDVMQKDTKHLDIVTPLSIPPMPKDNKEKEDEALKEKLRKLESLLEKQMQPQPEESIEKKLQIPLPQPESEDDEEVEKTRECKELIRKQLLQNDVDEKIADSIMKELDEALPENAPVYQILASAYQRIILTMGQPYLIDTKPSDRTKFIYFFGSTGVGKTTTIAKIASKLKLEQKKKVALVTADTYRIAAVDQLKTYANILSVPLKVVYSPTELGEYLSELRDYDYCLIDTAGRSHKNEEQLKDLGNLLDQVPIADRQVYLVLNAGTKYSDLKEIAKVYSRITDFSIIFTKLDETSSAGSILNVRVETKCPLSYVTWGQNVPDDIGEIDAQKIAKQLLGGKE